MPTYDLMVKGKYVLPMDKNMTIIQDGVVAILGNTIEAVSSKEEFRKNFKAKQMIEANNSIVMPGLINTHTHAAMTYFRGLADDLPLHEWLENYNKIPSYLRWLF